MNTVKNINYSRNILKEYLKDEWHVETLQDYSNNEIEQLYSANGSNSINFGNASGCNFTLKHKKYDWHNLHIIYYNFPELGKPSTKITKDCAKKIAGLYETTIEPEDSIILIILENITDNLENAIVELYNNGQDILKEYSKDKEHLNNISIKHLRNIHIFKLEHLTRDIRKHIYVPKHECIRDKKDINKILSLTNTSINQLPIIKQNDIQAKILRLAPGDLCKIYRITETAGEIVYYRVCK